MNKTKLPSIFGILFIVAGIAAGVLNIRYQKVYKSTASGDISPKNVRVTNISDSSFSVTWTTDRQTTGFVEYKKAGETNKVETDRIQDDFTHFVDVKNLNPSTQYSFSIGSNDQTFDNNGAPWQVKTGVTLPKNESVFATGKVVDTNGNPIANTIVSITSQSSSTISTYTSEKGGWILNLSNLRSTTLDKSVSLLPTSILEISVQKGSLGTATANVFVENSNPIPTMTIGNVYDFRNTENNLNTDLPSANLNLPESSSQESNLK